MIISPPQSDVAFDIECYPNVFTAFFIHIASKKEWLFEISDRVNNSVEFNTFLRLLQTHKMRLVGYNNLEYDYYVIHKMLDVFAAQGIVYPNQIFSISDAQIKSEERFKGIAPWLVMIPEVDLLKIHHFDNHAKATSLKMIENNMRSENVQDLPYKPGSFLTSEEIDNLIIYNKHDVEQTVKFYRYSLPMIQFRDKLSQKYNQDWVNYNDTKLGKEFFITELEKAKSGLCYTYVGKKKTARQTPRASIPIGPLILPYIRFDRKEFNDVLDHMRKTTLTVTKDPPEFKDLCAIVNGFQFDFGAGGIHGSVKKRITRSTETHIVIDCDVVSYYPSIPIANRFYPEHLTEVFCDVYADLLKQRRSFPKGTPENAMLKLALNGVYGESNQKFGVFLDPQYTMQVTINGQLSLAMLSEKLIFECDAEMIQANTDGLTVRIPRDKREKYDEICSWWQKLTKLDLEFVDYDGMWIRDVNNYISRSVSGKIKRVGAYQWHTPDMQIILHENGDVEEVKGVPAERAWHQDLGGLVIPKAAEAVMLRGESLEDFIRSHDDPFDFMLRVKVPRSSRLVLHEKAFPTPIKQGKPPVIVGYKGTMPEIEQAQNISRYYVATDGRMMTKIMPQQGTTPTKMLGDQPDLNPDNERYFSIEAGHKVALCNVASDFDWSNVNYDYYIAEARKLLLTPGDLFAKVH